MAQIKDHADSLEHALETLRDHMGTRWHGREGAGRAEMLRILRETLGYDKQHANTVIDTLIHMDRIHYHPTVSSSAAAGQSSPATFGRLSIGGAGAGLAFSLGYWQIGSEHN